MCHNNSRSQDLKVRGPVWFCLIHQELPSVLDVTSRHLYQEMMTRLISETPDHPVPFLINHLEGRQGGSASLHRVLLGPAALWAQSPSAGARRDLKGHEKPWQEHPRKPKKSKSDLEMCTLSPPSPDSKSLSRLGERPSQDSWSRSDSHDFDELSHILLESKKLGKALESLSRSLAASDELDQAFNSALQRPRVIGRWTGRADSDADPLASEMLHPPLPRGYRETSEPIVSLKMVTKSRSLKQQQLYHKKQLAAMLAQESFDSTGSLYVSDSDIDDEDEAMELMEDLDDLRMEGVTNLMPSRTKASHGRGSHSPQPQAKLTLNICSRCARLQGDGLADTREEEESCVQEVPEVQYPVPDLRTSVEEGESVSQVTRPGAPGWSSGFAPIRDWSSMGLSQLGEMANGGGHTADLEKYVAKAMEEKPGRGPRSPLSSLLLPPPLALQNLPLSEQLSKLASPLPILGNKPTSLLLGPLHMPTNSSNRARTPSGCPVLPPGTPAGLLSQGGSPDAFLQKSRTVTPTSHSGWGRTLGSTSQIQRSRPTTPTNQAGWSRPTTPPKQSVWGIPATPPKQSVWGIPATPPKQSGWDIPTTPLKQTGWSIPSTPTSQGGWNIPMTPIKQSGWSVPNTPTKQVGWSVPNTPTKQVGWSVSSTPTKHAGWSVPNTPTKHVGWSVPNTPTKHAGWSVPSTPTKQAGWSISNTPTKQVGWSLPTAPSKHVGWSIPSTPTNQGGWNIPTTPTDKPGRSRSVTPTNQAGRSRSVTPTNQTGRSRSVTPTNQTGRRGSITPTNQTGRRGSITPTNQTGRNRCVTPTDPTGLITPAGTNNEVLWPTDSPNSILSEAEFYQQLQAMKQPWILPSDTESEDGMTGPGPASSLGSSQGWR
ncbi:uncharacterized protein C8orf34 homolog isoform X3 [Paramormyrops kingsleyae]|uniref:uncharacterized protein C8orf34 homolog isoform X3 n=1 Tax=Paramormyrops kingsleyae TaxID=1676925 RepID=UPI003B97A655